ncbi:DUF2726 domain-containing protein [Salmonella enterica]|uniref:DUF2726 domain-containing protein n=1 Tax=Salmonella enterica TaxID=28901 RepID=UPI0009B07674|nr:DUF2726 domain-containing protein [Salmonella enterica]
MEYIVFLAVILLILILPGRAKKYTGNQKYIDRLLKKHRCYQAKHFMTAREREFFRELCRALAGYPLLVMAQVRLVDVVQVCPGFSEAENRRLFRQISQWHCDYVVVDQQDFTVRAILTPKGTPADIRREGNLDGLEKPEGSSATLMLNVLLHNFQRRTSARASKV